MKYALRRVEVIDYNLNTYEIVSFVRKIVATSIARHNIIITQTDLKNKTFDSSLVLHKNKNKFNNVVGATNNLRGLSAEVEFIDEILP